MKIDKSKLRVGLWYTDEEGNIIPNPNDLVCPEGAVYAHSCFPLQIREEIYRIREDGGYGSKDKVLTSSTTLSRSTGKLAVAMVNSGDYDLYEALAVLAQCCERCCNVLWNKYLPEEDGYPEYSEEWKKCNTVCDFCKEEPNGDTDSDCQKPSGTPQQKQIFKVNGLSETTKQIFRNNGRLKSDVNSEELQ